MSPLRVARYLLFLSLALGMISVAGEVNPVYTLATLAALVVGTITEERGLPHLPNTPVTVGAILLILINLSTLTLTQFFNHVMGILFILISAKLLTKKQVRDYLQLFLLSLLLIAGAAVVRWGMEFGLLLAANIFLLISGLLFLFTYTEKETISPKEARSLFLWGGIMSLSLLPATVLFFLILPRPSIAFTPGWAGGKTAKSGFGERITPGKVENIKKDPSVAMRVEWLNGPRPKARELYWRGKVYMNYRMGTWETPTVRKRLSLPTPPKGTDVTYRIFLEPQESNALFSLGIPLGLSLGRGKAFLAPGYTLKVPSLVTNRMVYILHSRLVKAYPPLIDPKRFLQVPPAIATRLLPLARSLAPHEKDPLALARAVETYLKTNYKYSLQPKNPSPYPVVSFLLNKGSGHCEYFATAMVLLMRLRGVPARMVAGFQGGEWNDLGKYYMVRNSHAHTWVEVYKKGTGWVPFDPTPSSAQGEGGNMRISSLSRFLDYLRFQWYHWVISYDVERQTRLLKKALSLFSPSTPKALFSPSHLPRKGMLLFFASIAGLFLGLKTLSRWRKRPRTWGERLVKVLEEGGIALLPGETLLELAQRIEGERPQLAEKMKEAVELYYWKEYGGGGVPQETLESKLKELKRLLKAPGN